MRSLPLRCLCPWLQGGSDNEGTLETHTVSAFESVRYMSQLVKNLSKGQEISLGSCGCCSRHKEVNKHPSVLLTLFLGGLGSMTGVRGGRA